MRLIEREMGYYENKPVMILRPAMRDNRKRFIVKLDDLWKYSDSHNELFESFMANKVLQICRLFDIPVPKGVNLFTQVMVSVARTIMDGIDDLVKMPPYREGHDDPDTVIDMPMARDVPDIEARMMLS